MSTEIEKFRDAVLLFDQIILNLEEIDEKLKTSFSDHNSFITEFNKTKEELTILETKLNGKIIREDGKSLRKGGVIAIINNSFKRNIVALEKNIKSTFEEIEQYTNLKEISLLNENLTRVNNSFVKIENSMKQNINFVEDRMISSFKTFLLKHESAYIDSQMKHDKLISDFDKKETEYIENLEKNLDELDIKVMNNIENINQFYIKEIAQLNIDIKTLNSNAFLNNKLVVSGLIATGFVVGTVITIIYNYIGTYIFYIN